jgi:hypothetical protein
VVIVFVSIQQRQQQVSKKPILDRTNQTTAKLASKIQGPIMIAGIALPK